jgi:hypothetical protein
VIIEANGVTSSIPSHEHAAKSPATVVDTPACLSNRISSGDSIMTPDISNIVDPKMAISPRLACALESDALSALCDSREVLN